jgi:hypothetical protein
MEAIKSKQQSTRRINGDKQRAQMIDQTQKISAAAINDEKLIVSAMIDNEYDAPDRQNA